MSGIYRVSDMWRSTTLLNSVRRGNLALGRVQQQLATGERILAPSDDPAAAHSAMGLQRILEQQRQVAANITHATTLFNMTDSALGDAANLLREAQTIAQANVGTMVTPQEREAAAQLISELTNHMLTLANQRLGDVYVFGGTANTTAPFVNDPAGIRYVGMNAATRGYVGGPGYMEIGLTGEQVFGAMSSQVRGYRDLSPAMSPQTRLADLRGAAGGGITLGSILIDDGVSAVTVDLTGADRVQDVVDRINAAGGGVLTASIGANALTISSTNAGADLRVLEVGSGRTAHDLGLYRATGQGDSFTGSSVRPVLTETTLLTDLRNGWGVNLAAGITITCGGKTETIGFAGDQTVGDLLNRINTSGLGVLARINGQGTGLDVVNLVSGAQMYIGENGGTTASELGLRSMRAGTKLAELNGGAGVQSVAGQTDFRVVARDGASFEVDISGADTVNDVIDRINAAAGAAGVAVTAALATIGNGIVLTDATGGADVVRVEAVNASGAAAGLGLEGAGTGNTLVGRDVNGIEPGGVFAHLAQLRDALRDGQSWAITRAAGRLQEDLDRLVGLRARVGGLVQDLSNRAQRLEDQQIANEALLSELKDVDFAEAITRFQALQMALQGNLMTGAQIVNLSLLDFLR